MDKDYCKDCPMSWSSRDYWGEYDEGCLKGIHGWYNRKYKLFCHLPICIKRIYSKYNEWKLDRWWEKHHDDFDEDYDETMYK